MFLNLFLIAQYLRKYHIKSKELIDTKQKISHVSFVCKISDFTEINILTDHTYATVKLSIWLHFCEAIVFLVNPYLLTTTYNTALDGMSAR